MDEIFSFLFLGWKWITMDKGILYIHFIHTLYFIQTLRTEFWIKSAFEGKSQVVPACKISWLRWWRWWWQWWWWWWWWSMVPLSGCHCGARRSWFFLRVNSSSAWIFIFATVIIIIVVIICITIVIINTIISKIENEHALH